MSKMSDARCEYTVENLCHLSGKTLDDDRLPYPQVPENGVYHGPSSSTVACQRKLSTFTYLVAGDSTPTAEVSFDHAFRIEKWNFTKECNNREGE